MATMREIRAAMLDASRGVGSTELYERRDRLTIELQLVVRYEPMPIRTPPQLYGGIARKAGLVSQTSQ
jgi:hypothetical protein